MRQLNKYPIFTPEMKKTHTILVPDMLPGHFGLILSVFRQNGYKLELLRTSTREVVDEGLKNVHNDTCYPALLVIGQFMEALKSGRYNPNTTALLLVQTGGGCRASNYISLLRKALKKQFPQVPVLSLNFSGLEKASSIEMNLTTFLSLVDSVFYSDLLMLLYNQCKPYELIPGKTDEVREKWQKRLGKDIEEKNKINKNETYKKILDDFAAIERHRGTKIKVGIVGEIYVKYSALANNDLEKFLINEKCEPVVPLLSEFLLYAATAVAVNKKLYGHANMKTAFYKIAYQYLYSLHKSFIKTIQKHNVFEPPHDFKLLIRAADKFIHRGVVMGEGWLITAEMAMFCETGVNNVICAQPFGCLPNHIVGKGKLRAIKEAYPNANIIAVDYDPGATKVNQENRIKLMLSNVSPA